MNLYAIPRAQEMKVLRSVSLRISGGSDSLLHIIWLFARNWVTQLFLAKNMCATPVLLWANKRCIAVHTDASRSGSR